MSKPSPNIAALLYVVAGALALFVLAIVFGRIAGADGGSYADWLAATATLAAFGAAVIAARYAAGAFGLETQREARWVENQQRAQASMVAAWPDEKYFERDISTVQIRRMVSMTKHGVYVRNASDLPVNDCEVTAVVTQVRPDYPEPVVWTPITQAIGLVPPSDEPRFYAIDSLTDRLANVHEQHAVTIEIEFTFVDNTGIRWRRDTRGQLSEITEQC